jgi:hypothetical protein
MSTPKIGAPRWPSADNVIKLQRRSGRRLHITIDLHDFCLDRRTEYLISGNNDYEDRKENERVLGHRLSAGRLSSSRI